MVTQILQFFWAPHAFTKSWLQHWRTKACPSESTQNWAELRILGLIFEKYFGGHPGTFGAVNPPPPLRQILDLPLVRTSFRCRVTPWWSPIEAWVRSNWKQRILVLIMEIIWDVCVDKTGTAFGTFHASCSDVPARFVPSCSALLNVYS